MLLRERQKEFVEKNIAALTNNGSTLGVAPTGAGKTICLSSVIGGVIKNTASFKICVLSHRDELNYQNLTKFRIINPHISTSIYNARLKSWEGQVTFAMVGTLAREPNLRVMPRLDLIVIDEAHHATAVTYQKVIDRAKELNPLVQIFGVTATPNRGDKSSLGKIFNNCGDQIKIGELIASGHLVRPKTFIIDLGNTQEKLQELRVRASSGDYSEQEVAGILDTIPLNSEVVKHWREKASDRKTAIFCSSIEHAKNITNAFNEDGIKAELVTGQCSASQRKKILADVTSGNVQVIVNVAILTEGWDFPPISCVVLLRQSSYKSTMIQMIGRGLRTIDPAIHPNIEKKDCIVLDFGISSIIHGNLEQSVDLTSRDEGYQLCTGCKKKIPKSSVECPLCGCILLCKERQDQEKKDDTTPRVMENFRMKEIDLLERYGFFWTILDLKQEAMIASGFNSWCYITKQEDNTWVAIGGSTKRGEESNKQIPIKVLYSGSKAGAIRVASDFLYCFEDEETAKKTSSWHKMDVTENQLKWLPEKYKCNEQLTRGDASNYLTFFLMPKIR